jgi:hypothetical protein
VKGRSIVLMMAVSAILAGCGSNPGVELSNTTKVVLQEVVTIGVRRALNTPRAAEKAANIRAVAVRLQSVATATTVAELKAVVGQEVDSLGLAPIDRADAQSLINVLGALLVDYIGQEKLDSAAQVKVGEFLGLVVAALPPPGVE